MNTIPYKIHQVYTRGMAALPAEVHASIDSLRQLNPGWEYYFYDEKKCWPICMSIMVRRCWHYMKK